MIFSGSSNKPLAEKLAKALGVKLGVVELSRFANDEARVFVAEKDPGKEVVVVQSLSQPTDHNLIEFCLLCDALKRHGVKEITAVIPWLGYSKQDKVFRAGEPLSVKVIAQMLQVVPLEKIITFDLHNLAILGFFDVPVVNLSARELFLDYFRKSIPGLDRQSRDQRYRQTLVVAPDAGAVKASTAFAHELGVDVAYVDKKRDLTSGAVSIDGVSRDVTGTRVVIVDDMIATGSTLIEVSHYLKEKGAAVVSVAATHHLYVPGTQGKLEQSAVDELVVTDTVSVKEKSKKLTVLSVAGLVAEEIG